MQTMKREGTYCWTCGTRLIVMTYRDHFDSDSGSAVYGFYSRCPNKPWYDVFLEKHPIDEQEASWFNSCY